VYGISVSYSRVALDTVVFATCYDPPKWLVCWTRRWSIRKASVHGTATQEKRSKGAGRQMPTKIMGNPDVFVSRDA
jgi:hypothetical protein